MSFTYFDVPVPTTPGIQRVMDSFEEKECTTWKHALDAEVEISYYTNVLNHTITHDNGNTVVMSAPLFRDRVVTRQA